MKKVKQVTVDKFSELKINNTKAVVGGGGGDEKRTGTADLD